MDSLESIERASKNLLSNGTKEDTPTGSTPRKRKWQYLDDWRLTESRQVLLGSRNEHKTTVVEPEPTFAPTQAPSKPADIENEVPGTRAPPISNIEEKKTATVPLEPLVDSRRRNLPRTTRRAR